MWSRTVVALRPVSAASSEGVTFVAGAHVEEQAPVHRVDVLRRELALDEGPHLRRRERQREEELEVLGRIRAHAGTLTCLYSGIAV